MVDNPQFVWYNSPTKWEINQKKENTMTNTVSKFYQDLYDGEVDRKAEYAGDLAAMAFSAHEVLRMIEIGRIDGVQGKNRIELLQKEVAKYYQGKGSSSIFAEAYAKDEWEAGIEAGMKEAV